MSRRVMIALLAAAIAACSGGGVDEPQAEARPAEPEIIAPAPALPNLEFVNQANEPVFLEQLRGKPTLLTYIYTRCPMPEMCPATSHAFQQVQRALPDEHRGNVRLISVSFDPLDTAEILGEYARLWEADPAVWTLLTGTEESVRRLGAAYGFWYEAADEIFRHAMISVILLPDGALHRVLLGSVWDTDEVAEALTSLVPPTTAPTPH